MAFASSRLQAARRRTRGIQAGLGDDSLARNAKAIGYEMRALPPVDEALAPGGPA